jgi:hypothetical protein
MHYVVFSLIIILTACSPLDLIKPMLSGSSGPSLEVETVVGDKEESVVGSIGDTSTISTESLSGGVNTTYIEDIPPWVVILLILGWLLPSHTEIYREIKSWFRGK